jgi:hypothetical protein
MAKRADRSRLPTKKLLKVQPKPLRSISAVQLKCGEIPVVLGAAGEVDTEVSEPGDSGSASDRRTDRPSQANARGVRKGEALGLSEDEVAFYDALEVNDSAVKVLGDATLKTIARELVDTVRRNTTIDWTVRENVRAHLRVLRIFRKYGYPPDKQENTRFTSKSQ